MIDGFNALYRAFFAIPGLRAPDGTPTNAAYGFETMLGKILREEDPDHVVVVLDAPGRTFRHELYADYKATRDAQPEDLTRQIPLVRELALAHRIRVVEAEGVEADDVIATLVRSAPADARIGIVSTDKDLMQLVDDRVELLDGIKDRRYGPDEVEARFGVLPERVLDLRALVGDPSDNIPGVKGIGEKGAAKLIGEWGDLESLIEHRDEISAKRTRKALEAGIEDARLSKRLATLRNDVPLDLALEDTRREEPDLPKLREIYTRLGFTRLLDGLGETAAGAGGGEPASAKVSLVDSAEALEALVNELAGLPSVAVLCVAESAPAPALVPAGLAFALGSERAAYVPMGGSGELAVDEVLEKLRELFGEPGRVGWVAWDSKRPQIVFGERGVETSVPHFDVAIAAHLLDPAGPKSLEVLALRELSLSVRSWEDLAGRGARARSLPDLARDEVADWAGQQVCAVALLCPPLGRRLHEDGLIALFEEVELPLTRVLQRMERAGVRVDEEYLGRLSREYQRDLDRIESEITELAGEEFLISSPKQLQRILFDKLKLPPTKKTKTGYSTDEGVLEQLAVQHELPVRILAYRRLAKLKNTYVDALPPLVNERTGRIHPTFNQLGAATGRLSATHPNVQNIPIRTPEGVRIREAFIAAEDRVLLSADYSQVELRILAHFSGDESLIDAFGRGDDIHRQTAAEVWEVEPDAVTDDLRARAKAVNFGIIYGLSAFGLANQLGIASAEAQEAIDVYFQRYRGVRRFLDETIADAKQRGFVTTLLGRRRYLPDLASRNRVLRQAAERMAVNTVIQGTAADLIKKAMVDVDAALHADGLRARMILQVHDELVFELPGAELPALTDLVRGRMEGVHPLRVPLLVDIESGANWREAH